MKKIIFIFFILCIFGCEEKTKYVCNQGWLWYESSWAVGPVKDHDGQYVSCRDDLDYEAAITNAKYKRK